MLEVIESDDGEESGGESPPNRQVKAPSNKTESTQNICDTKTTTNTYTSRIIFSGRRVVFGPMVGKCAILATEKDRRLFDVKEIPDSVTEREFLFNRINNLFDGRIFQYATLASLAVAAFGIVDVVILDWLQRNYDQAPIFRRLQIWLNHVNCVCSTFFAMLFGMLHAAILVGSKSFENDFRLFVPAIGVAFLCDAIFALAHGGVNEEACQKEDALKSIRRFEEDARRQAQIRKEKSRFNNLKNVKITSILPSKKEDIRPVTDFTLSTVQIV